MKRKKHNRINSMLSTKAFNARRFALMKMLAKEADQVEEASQAVKAEELEVSRDAKRVKIEQPVAKVEYVEQIEGELTPPATLVSKKTKSVDVFDHERLPGKQDCLFIVESWGSNPGEKYGFLSR